MIKIGYYIWTLLHANAFIPLACAECDDSMPFAGASSILPCYIFFPSIIPHLILPSTSWSTSQSYCFQIHTQHSLGILFSSILCTCPNQLNLYNLTFSVILVLSTIAQISLLLHANGHKKISLKVSDCFERHLKSID